MTPRSRLATSVYCDYRRPSRCNMRKLCRLHQLCSKKTGRAACGLERPVLWHGPETVPQPRRYHRMMVAVPTPLLKPFERKLCTVVVPSNVMPNRRSIGEMILARVLSREIKQSAFT